MKKTEPFDAKLRARIAGLEALTVDLRDDNVRLAVQVAALEAENAELKTRNDELDGFASDAPNDIEYWRRKARDHCDAAQGAIAENVKLREKPIDEATEAADVREVRRLRDELARSRHGLGETIKAQAERIAETSEHIEHLREANHDLVAENARLRGQLPRPRGLGAQCEKCGRPM